MGQGRHTLRSINDPVYPLIPTTGKIQLTRYTVVNLTLVSHKIVHPPGADLSLLWFTIS